MNKQKVLILDQQRINWKLRRMAYQIWERNSDRDELILIGIEKAGVCLAAGLSEILQEISPLRIRTVSLRVNKKQPLKDMPVFAENLNGRSVVLIDDVANSGKTLLYALKPLLGHAPDRIMIAVLVDRTHKSFPITPDIIGHSVSTTLQDHIEVVHDEHTIQAVYLQ